MFMLTLIPRFVCDVVNSTLRNSKSGRQAAGVAAVANTREKLVEEPKNDEIFPEPIDASLSLASLQGLEEETKFLQKSVLFPFVNQHIFSLSTNPLPKGLIFNGDEPEVKLLVAQTMTAEMSRALDKPLNFFRRPERQTFKPKSKEGGAFFDKLAEAALVASMTTPSVLFLDDHMLRAADIVNQLYNLMQRVEPGRVLIVTAPSANYVGHESWDRDVGPNLSFSAPNDARRRQIIETWLAERKQTLSSENLADFIKQSQGYTSKKLNELLGKIYLSAVYRIFPTVPAAPASTSTSSLEKPVEVAHVDLKFRVEDVQILPEDWKEDFKTTTVPPLAPNKKPDLSQEHSTSAVELTDALSFVKKVKSRFEGQMDKYKQFLEILYIFLPKKQAGLLPTSSSNHLNLNADEACSKVAKLFEGHEDLLQEFDQIVHPENFKLCPTVVEVSAQVPKPGPKNISPKDQSPDPTNSNLSFTSLQGLEEETKFLQKSILFPLANPQIFSHCANPLPKGLMFNGNEPEVKLLVARAMTAELSRVLGKPLNFVFRPESQTFNLNSKEGQAYFDKLAEAALTACSKMRPSILFLDDHMLRAADVSNQLPKLMAQVEPGQVLVVTAPSKGYLDHESYDPIIGPKLIFHAPNEARRRQIVETWLTERKQTLSTQNLANFVKKTQGHTYKKLNELLEKIYLSAVYRNFPAAVPDAPFSTSTSSLAKPVVAAVDYKIRAEDVQILPEDWKDNFETTTVSTLEPNKNSEFSESKPDVVPAVELNDAISFISKVKSRFEGQMDKYKQFLEILYVFLTKKRAGLPPTSSSNHLNLNADEACSKVAKLFEGHEDLLQEFDQIVHPKDFKPSPSADAAAAVPKPSPVPQNISPEDQSLGQVVVDDSLSFSSVGGLEEQIESLRELILFPMLNKEAFKEWGIEPAKGIIFHGPPGTGKTLLAKTLAAELTRASSEAVAKQPFSFFYRKGTDCYRKYIGETEGILRELFELAEAKKPSIIFFDEIDGLCPERTNENDTGSNFNNGVVTTLVGLMDSVKRGQVLVIAATNRLSSLDPALVRPGRFDRNIAFRPPKSEGRTAILKIHTSNWKPGRYKLEMFNEMAERTEGYTGADLEQLCRQTLICALRRQFPAGRAGETTSAAAIEALEITRPDWYSALKSVRGSESNVFDNAVTSGKSLPSGIAKLISGIVAEIVQKVEPFLATEGVEHDVGMNGAGIKSLLIWDAGVGRARSIDSFIVPALIQHSAMKDTTTFTLTPDKLGVNYHGNHLQKFMKQVLTCSKTAILYIPRLDEFELKLIEGNVQHLFLDQMDAIRGKDVVVLATASSPLSSLSAGGVRRIFGKGCPESRSYQIRKFQVGERREFFESIVGGKIQTSLELLAKIEDLTCGASLYDIIDLGEEIRQVVAAAAAAGDLAHEEDLSKLEAILDKFGDHGDDQLCHLYS